jgi:thiol peroxidase
MHLEDLPLDVGYASQEVVVSDINAKEYTLGGQNGKTQLIITTPFIDDTFLKELQRIEEMLPTGGEHEVTTSLVVANKMHTSTKLKKINFYIDTKEELGDFYGLRLKGEPYENELTKAAILISKDGAIYYDDFLEDIYDTFNIDTLYRKIASAQVCYTGKGCH